MKALVAVILLLAGAGGCGLQLWQALSHGKVRNLDGRKIVYGRDFVAFRTIVGFYAGLAIALLYTAGLLIPELISL